jgi:hypothetical protein
MPVLNFVDPTNKIVVTTCCGHVTRGDLATGLENLAKHPDFRPDFRQLIDFSQAERLDLGYKDLFGICRAYDPFSKEGKRAIVAPGTGIAYGLGRMYQSITDSEHLEVFHSLVEAISWLGVEGTVLEASIRQTDSQTFRPHRRRGKGNSA